MNKARPEAEAEAKRTLEDAAGEAEERARRPSARRSGSSPRRTSARADIEAVIADLEKRRDAVLAELERLASGIAGTATEHRRRAQSPNDTRERADTTRPQPAVEPKTSWTSRSRDGHPRGN